MLSLMFLAFFYGMLRRMESAATAALATLLLGTSAGWVAYSRQ